MFLEGKWIVVLSMYIGGFVLDGVNFVYISEGVWKVWQSVWKVFEDLGVEVIIVFDFLVVMVYENFNFLFNGVDKLLENWNWFERGFLVVYGWNMFFKGCVYVKIFDFFFVDEFNIFFYLMCVEVELVYFQLVNSIYWGKFVGYI